LISPIAMLSETSLIDLGDEREEQPNFYDRAWRTEEMI